MVSIRKQLVKGYVLLESLIATLLLSVITGLILCEVGKNRQEQIQSLRELEVLNTAKMAYDARINHLDLNGVSVEIRENSNGVSIFDGKKEAIRIEIKN
ncbi:competence type IV pilus minor pilin ComGE [Streptococcaceae bacterium ESL0729]|nr:competence type IV pilus minor pilin ComGE [Streptococcaceae bacterium ESL0729]